MPTESVSNSIVYIVDDDPLIRESLTRMFLSIEMKAIAFADAQQFLGHRRADLSGCLILDYRMPGLTGLDLQQELIAQNNDLPIIFLTAHGNIPLSVKAVRSGAVEFLTKPVDRQVLIDCVRNAITWHLEHRAEEAELREICEKVKTLTPREYQVIELAIEGLLNKQIAKRLGIAERTVKEHRHQTMKKMGETSIAIVARQWERAHIDAHGD